MSNICVGHLVAEAVDDIRGPALAALFLLVAWGTEDLLKLNLGAVGDWRVSSRTTASISMSTLGALGSSRKFLSVLAFCHLLHSVASCNGLEKKLSDSAKSRCRVAWLRP